MSYKFRLPLLEIISKDEAQESIHFRAVCIKDKRNAKYEETVSIADTGLDAPITETQARAWIKEIMIAKRPSRVDDMKAEVDAVIAAVPVESIEKFDSWLICRY